MEEGEDGEMINEKEKTGKDGMKAKSGEKRIKQALVSVCHNRKTSS